MQYLKIVGIEKISYDKKDGTHVEAVKYHATDDTKRDNVVGVTVSDIYVSAAALSRVTTVPQLGDLVFPVFSSKGYFVDFLPGPTPSK